MSTVYRTFVSNSGQIILTPYYVDDENLIKKDNLHPDIEKEFRDIELEEEIAEDKIYSIRREVEDQIDESGFNGDLNALCATCDARTLSFTDALSTKEYTISGMCQKCQNSVFDNPPQQFDD